MAGIVLEASEPVVGEMGTLRQLGFQASIWNLPRGPGCSMDGI